MSKSRMTLKDAKSVLKMYGMTINKTPYNEYRVTFKGMDRQLAEEHAYYTEWIDDAVSTGVDMAKRMAKFLK